MSAPREEDKKAERLEAVGCVVDNAGDRRRRARRRRRLVLLDRVFGYDYQTVERSLNDI
jgi:hypothetical protein